MAQKDMAENPAYKQKVPRMPDKGSNPPTYHDWQAKEMIAESRAKRKPAKRSRGRTKSR